MQKRSFIPNLGSAAPSLPLSQRGEHHQDGGLDTLQRGLRRRLSSLSLKIQPAASSSWDLLRRTRSVSSMGASAGGSIRKWWDWGWSWIMSRKPVFAQDLEMNEEETKAIGSHNRGSWRHVFYKVRSEIRRLVGSDNNVGLPQTCRYDPVSYAQNFDHGRRSPSVVEAY